MAYRRLVQVLFLIVMLLVLPSPSFAGVTTADLSITKDDGVATAVPGSSVVYTIVASNAGAADVTGATVADTFPAVLTCTWTCSASAGSSCTASGMGDINDSVNLLNGGSATYTATCAIDSSAAGSLANTATISSAVTDPNSANNSATDTDTLGPSADLSMSSVVTPNPVYVGNPFSIAMTITNAGPSDATGVTVTTTLPSFVTFDSTSGCSEDPNGNPTCTVGNIAAGGMASFTMFATATDVDSGPIDMSVSSAVSDPNSGDNTDIVTVSALAATGIPATSDFGVFVMVLLLLGAGILVARRQG